MFSLLIKTLYKSFPFIWRLWLIYVLVFFLFGGLFLFFELFRCTFLLLLYLWSHLFAVLILKAFNSNILNPFEPFVWFPHCHIYSFKYLAVKSFNELSLFFCGKTVMVLVKIFFWVNLLSFWILLYFHIRPDKLSVYW